MNDTHSNHSVLGDYATVTNNPKVYYLNMTEIYFLLMLSTQHWLAGGFTHHGHSKDCMLIKVQQSFQWQNKGESSESLASCESFPLEVTSVHLGSHFIGQRKLQGHT